MPIPGRPIRRIFNAIINANPSSGPPTANKPWLGSSTIRNLLYAIIPQAALLFGNEIDADAVQQGASLFEQIIADGLSLFALVRAAFGRRKADTPLT